MLPIIRSVLVIRLSSMGDVLLATMLVRELRTQFPDARLDVCVNEEWSDIFRYNPHCSNVLAYNRSWSRTELSQWKKEIQQSLQETTGNGRYDWILDLQRNHRSRCIRSGLGKNVRRIKKHRVHKLALVHLKSNFHSKTLHSTERYRETSSTLDVHDDGQGLEFWLPEEKVLHIRQTTTSSSSIVRIALAPGAHHATKRWLPEHFAKSVLILAERFRREGRESEIVLLGGKEDTDLCAGVASLLQETVRVENACGTSSLMDTARMLDSCTLLLCNDTGVMHLASARGVPLVAVFGSTVPELGFAPFRVPHRIAQAPVDCRPCTHIGRESCPKGHFKCMKLVSAESVADAAWELVSRQE